MPIARHSDLATIADITELPPYHEAARSGRSLPSAKPGAQMVLARTADRAASVATNTTRPGFDWADSMGPHSNTRASLGLLAAVSHYLTPVGT